LHWLRAMFTHQRLARLIIEPDQPAAEEPDGSLGREDSNKKTNTK
jgi:hypothetical protein